MVRKWFSIFVAFTLLIGGVAALIWLVFFARTFSLLFIGSAITVSALALGWIYEDWREWFPAKTAAPDRQQRKFSIGPAALFGGMFVFFSYMAWPMWIPTMFAAAFIISELESRIYDLKYDLRVQRDEMELMAEQIKNLNMRAHWLEQGRDA